MRNMYKVSLGLLVALVASIGSAYAALPAIVATTISDIETDGLALVDLIWPIVGVFTGAFVLIKLFKRGSSKI